MIRDVHLHGRLGTKFGPVHALDVESPAEAFQALSYQLPGFREYVSKRRYVVSVGQGTVLDQEALDLRLGQGRDIHLTPAGLVTGIETILLAGILLFTAVATVAVLSMPGVPTPGAREESTRTDSFIFDGPVNNSEQGHPVPLIYGRMRVGSVVGSTGIATTDVTEAGVSVDPSNPGGGGGSYPGYVGSTPGLRDSPYGDDWQYSLDKGGKGGGSGQTRSAQEDPNSLQSQATAKILDIIGEGEIVGLVDGLRSVYFDGTPLQNADDSFNFAGVAVEQRTGLPDQDFMPGFSQTENTVQVDTRVAINPGPVTRSVLDPAATVARVTVRIPQLYRQDTTNGDLKATSVSVKVLVQADGGGFTEVTTMVFNGKTTSGYQRSVDVRLPNGTQRDIRLVRETPDSDVASLLNETRWDLLTSVVEAKLSYPDTALVGITVDARQFGSNVPGRGYEVKGLIIDVPSNYDPETRAYAGVWDGTFKRAWTDNPAWVFRDLVANRRYGLGSRVPLAALNKWALYSIAQYNDELVPDGFGGEQPRYTLNCCINTRADAREVLASVASNFRGWAYLSAGTITAAQDRPEDPSVIVTPANVTRDEPISYSRVTSADQRRSVAVVYWNDPEDGYRLTPELYEVPDLVRRFGRKTGNEVTAFGVTNRGQANRMARWIMEDEAQGSNSVATYGVGDDHAFVEPGRIAVLHDPMFTAERRGGRVRASGPHQVTLDKPITLAPGTAYLLRVTLPDGTTRVRNVTNAAGVADVITLAGNAFALDPLPGAVWTVESAQVANRQFRVRAIEQDEPPYRVRAVLHDPTKYERVELGRDISSPGFMDLPSGPLERPSGLDIKEFLLPLGTAAEPAVQFSWNSAVDPRVALYQVQYQPPGAANWTALADNLDTSRDVRGATPGTWSFRVRALDVLGNKTPWMVYSEYLGAQQSDLPNVSGLALAVDDTTLQVTLVWANPLDTRPLRTEVLFGPDYGTAENLGTVDAQEYTVSQLGRYWVRTTFMGAVSAGPPSVLVEAADAPRPAWEVIQGRPETVSDLDPGYVASVNDSIGSLNTTVYDATTGLKVRSDSMFYDINVATTGLKARSDSMFADINTAATGLKDKTQGILDALNTPTTGVVARLTVTETTLNTPTTGLVSKVSALEAAIGEPGGSGLMARLVVAEEALVDLEAEKASVERVEVLEAQSRSLPNIIVNGGFTDGTNHWGKDTADAWSVFEHPTLGMLLNFQSPVVYTEARAVNAGDVISVSWEGVGGAYAQVQLLPGYENVGFAPFPEAWGYRAKIENQVIPPGTTGFRVVFYKGPDAFTYIARVKANSGAVATAWSDETSEVRATARLSLAETAITTNNSASVSRLEALETTINTATTGVSARLLSMENVVSTPTTGLVSKVGLLETQINTPSTGLLARIGLSETAITDLNTNKASVERVETMEARSRSVPNLIQGGDFSTEVATNWFGSDGTPVNHYVSSQIGSYGNVHGAQAHIYSKAYPAGEGESFSLSLDGEAAGGDAYAYIQFIPSYANGAVVYFAPHTWNDRHRSTDYALAPAGTTGFQVIVQRNTAAYVNVSRVKVNYGDKAADWTDDATASDSRARIISAETAITTNNSASVTRLDALETTLNTPTTGVSARLATNENVVSNPTTGLVVRTSSLETTLNTATTGVLARLGTLENVVTTPTTGLVEKISVLETQINTAGTGLSARMGTAETAITDLNTGKASVERVSFLEAYTHNMPNMLRNSDFSQGPKYWTGANWEYNTTGGQFGSYAICSAAGDQYLVSDIFRCGANDWFGFSFAGDPGTAPAASNLYVQYIREDNSVISDGNAGVDLTGLTWENEVHSTPFQAPSDCVKLRLVIHKGPATNYIAVTRVMFHRGTKPVAWMDNATATDAVARLGTVETAVTTNNSAAVLRLQALEATVNTPTTGVSARLGVAESGIASLITGKAEASRVSYLEARVRTSPNLIVNSTAAAGMMGWSHQVNDYIYADLGSVDGPRFLMIGGTLVTAANATTDYFPIQPSALYSFQGEFYAEGLTAGEVRAYVVYYRANNSIALYQVITVTTDKAWEHIKSEAFNVPGGDGIVKARIYIDVQSATFSVAGWRRLKLESGPICTYWSDDTTDIVATAKLTALETTVTTNNTAATGRLQSLESSVNTSGTGLIAKVATHDTAIADLNTGKASASSVTVLEVRSTSTPNLLPNPQFLNLVEGQPEGYYTNGTVTPLYDAQIGSYVNVSAGHYITNDPGQAAFPGMNLSFSFDGDPGGATDAQVYIQWLPSYAFGGGISAFSGDWTIRKFFDSNGLYPAPSGTTGWRIVAAAGASAAFNVSRIKVNYGGKATNWSSETEAKSAYAKITETSTVALDAQGKANAVRGVTLDVNGYVSGFASVNNGSTASFEVLADVFGIRSPGSGERTEYRAGNWYVYSPAEGTRTRYGKAFAGAEKITWWTGPDSVAEGSETKANAYVYISQNTVNGPRFGGSDAPTSGGGGTIKLYDIVTVSGSPTTSWTTIASSTFTSRPSAGYWDMVIRSISGSADGGRDLDFRVIENGASTALATGTASLLGGGMAELLSLDFSPFGPWPQTRPAGTIQLLLQCKTNTGSATITGEIAVDYKPGV